jgi:acetyltransferase EpsM
MTEPKPVLIPLLNPNEPEAVLAALHAKEGQWVEAGDLLCTLETTKSTSDLQTAHQGYVRGLRFKTGQMVQAGQVLCYLAASLEEELSILTPQVVPEAASQAEVPTGLRITQPALVLARSLGIDLAGLPVGPLITEAEVRRIQEKASPGISGLPLLRAAFDANAILIYGGGGHGKSIIDLLRAASNYHIVGIVDDGLAAAGVSDVMGLPVLGGSGALAEQHQKGVRLAVNAVGGIGNVSVRIEVFQRLAQAGFACPAAVHPRAMIEPSASLSPGVQAFALAYIGSEVKVGYGAIVNTGAIVSHECLIGDYANLSPGAILAGQVEIGPAALVGMGVTINLQVKVGAKARIGNGATVKSDVPAGTIVRAGSVWPD